MEKVVLRLEERYGRLLEDFEGVSSDVRVVGEVFEKLYGFLEDINAFLRLRHRAEVNRVVDIGKGVKEQLDWVDGVTERNLELFLENIVVTFEVFVVFGFFFFVIDFILEIYTG